MLAQPLLEPRRIEGMALLHRNDRGLESGIRHSTLPPPRYLPNRAVTATAPSPLLSSARARERACLGLAQVPEHPSHDLEPLAHDRRQDMLVRRMLRAGGVGM